MGIDDTLKEIFKRDWSNAGLIDLLVVLLAIIKLLLLLGNFAAVIYIMISGVRYLMAFGNDQVVTKAKAGLTAAITGLVIILLSYFIVNEVLTRIIAEPEVNIPEEIQDPT